MIDDIDPRFKDTEYLIEADDFSRHELWHRWHEEVQWEQDRSGIGVNVGTLADFPVCVSFLWAKLNGHRVCFYHATSRVVDYQLIEEWLDKACPSLNNNGTRYAKTDAQNFHHCVAHCKEEKV